MITNDIITGFEYKPNNSEPIRQGRALLIANDFPALDNFGGIHNETKVGKQFYDAAAMYVYEKITPFINHLKRIFVNDQRDLDTFLDYMAFKMQFPGVKPRWALVITGEQGIGKDIAIDACWHTYGLQYINNISPADVMGSFNDFMKCLILRISEVADLDKTNKWNFNEKVKVIISGHPDRMQINPKYGFKYWLNLCNGTILTTNHLEDGLYIPEGDRRYYVIKCNTWRALNMTIPERAAYFGELFSWFTTPDENGITGYEYIGNYLFWCRDISNFNANICPTPTLAKTEIMQISCEIPEWMDSALTLYSNILSNAQAIEGNAFDNLLWLYDHQQRPIVVNVRKLKEIILSTDDKNNTAPAKLAYSLKKAGYQRLDNLATFDKKWYAKTPSNTSTGSRISKEVFYYLVEPSFTENDKHLACYTENDLRVVLSRDLGSYLDVIVIRGEIPV